MNTATTTQGIPCSSAGPAARIGGVSTEMAIDKLFCTFNFYFRHNHIWTATVQWTSRRHNNMNLKQPGYRKTDCQFVVAEIRNCASLPPILQLVLETGNFLNQGASYGNASGFSLSSLKILFDTKANKPGITLLHYVAMELEKQDTQMLDWPNQIPSLTTAKSISVDELVKKLKNCNSELKRLTEHVSNVNCDKLKDRMDGFFQVRPMSCYSCYHKLMILVSLIGWDVTANSTV